MNKEEQNLYDELISKNKYNILRSFLQKNKDDILKALNDKVRYKDIYEVFVKRTQLNIDYKYFFVNLFQISKRNTFIT